MVDVIPLANTFFSRTPALFQPQYNCDVRTFMYPSLLSFEVENIMRAERAAFIRLGDKEGENPQYSRISAFFRILLAFSQVSNTLILFWHKGYNKNGYYKQIVYSETIF